MDDVVADLVDVSVTNVTVDESKQEVETRRLSTEKKPVAGSAFERLPDEIIEQVLGVTNPDGFASLVVLNRKWRAVSQQSHLYAHHLSQCPSYPPSHAASASSTSEDILPRLRRLFAREVKRNLFEAYVRPSQTIVTLVSNSISSSSAPGGEGMQFGASPRGYHILAYNSSRIYVLDVRGPELDVRREFKILRRPVSACITDDASLLAVLSSEMQVDLYDLEQSPPRRRQSIILDNNPRTIALSPCGTVLAAAYEGGIEVSSLDSSASSTDRRAVKCDAVDSLAFSFDGTQILGTTTHSSTPNTVILTAPYYDPGGNLANDSISALWTTSILFPNTSRDCSHAVLLQEGSHEEASWTFAYDRSFETFRAVRIDDLRNGTTYFTGPVPKATSQAKLLPCTLPATTYSGELVSAGFQGKEIWVYGVPEDLDAVPEVPPSHGDHLNAAPEPGRSNSGRSNASRRPSTRGHEGPADRVPQWQILCDKLRNNFIAGYKVSELSDVSSVKWVADFADSSVRERLVVAARGVSGPRLVTDEEDIDFVDGSRIALLDFDYSLANGTKREITIEVGTNKAEVLEEEQRDLETDVAIVRRRTVAQRRGGRNGGLLRAATAGARDMAMPPVLRSETTDDSDPLRPRVIGRSPSMRQTSSGSATDDQGDTASIEEQEAMDAPYAHASPRSGTTLRRAATAAAVSRTLNPRTADGRPIEYRRADGRAEHPHESDADNWVPPPPPYQKDDPGTLPAFLRAPAVAPLAPEVPALPTTLPRDLSARSRSQIRASFLQQPQQNFDLSLQRRPSHHRTASDSTTVSRSRVSDLPRPMSSPSFQVLTTGDDLYDLSAPVSPQMSPQAPALVQLSPTEPEDDLQPLQREVSQTETVLPPLPRTSIEEPTNDAVSVEEQISLPASNDQVPSVAPHPRTTSTADGETRIRRLSTVQTWPLGPQLHGEVLSANFAGAEPASAISVNAPISDFSASLPPLPSSDQLASLNRRVSRGYHPRRLSGGIPEQWTSSGYRGSGEGWVYHHQNSVRPNSMGSSALSQLAMEQPMIISTPSGVSGALDHPDRKMPGHGRENTILAPVPRRPQPDRFGNTRPTVERLEGLQRMDTIYSVTSHQDGRQNQDESSSRLLPKWLHTRSSPSKRTPSGVQRRRSRAERSAAKNMQDARKKGWKPRGGKNGKKDNAAVSENASSHGWTDVTLPSSTATTKDKDKKCVVM